MKGWTRLTVRAPCAIHLFIYPMIQFTTIKYMTAHSILSISYRAHCASQRLRFNIFCTISNCPSQHRVNCLFDIIIACKQDDTSRQMFRCDLVCDLLSVQPRHIDIQHRNSWLERADHFDRFITIGSLSNNSKILFEGKCIHHSLAK